MRFKSLCFPRTHLAKEFEDRLVLRGSKGRIYGWTDPVVVLKQVLSCGPASASNTATRKGFTGGSSEIRTQLGLTGVNYNSGRFRFTFINTSARDAFVDTVSKVLVNGYEVDLSRFSGQSTKNLESKESGLRAVAYADKDACDVQFTLI